MKKHVLALGLVAAVAVPVSANGLYVFGDVGRSQYQHDSKYKDVSASATGVSFGAGYDVNSSFAFEAGYQHIGRFTLDTSSYDTVIDQSAIAVSGVVKFPITREFNIHGRLGFANLTIETTSDIFVDVFSASSNKAFYGVGSGYTLNEHVSLRAEYVRYEKLGESTVSRVTLGATYSF